MENQPRSAMAVASLVLGIVALVTSVLPIINNLSFVMAVLGVIFAAVGLVGITKGKKSGKGLALAGLIISVIACVLVLVMQSMFSAALDQAMEESGLSTTTVEQPAPDGSTANDSAESSAPEPQAADQAPAQEAAYAVTIDGCVLTEDYEGNPAVTVTYTFTNNSDETTSPAVAVHEQVFQNGVQCDTAIVMDDSDNAGKSMNDVKPGASITYDISYEIVDTSDVTVEVEEFMSWDDTLLAEQTFSLA